MLRRFHLVLPARRLRLNPSRCYVIYHGARKAGVALVLGLCAQAASALSVAVSDFNVSPLLRCARPDPAC